jgi:hypothetical protein
MEFDNYNVFLFGMLPTWDLVGLPAEGQAVYMSEHGSYDGDEFFLSPAYPYDEVSKYRGRNYLVQERWGTQWTPRAPEELPEAPVAPDLTQIPNYGPPEPQVILLDESLFYRTDHGPTGQQFMGIPARPSAASPAEEEAELVEPYVPISPYISPPYRVDTRPAVRSQKNPGQLPPHRRSPQDPPPKP